MLFQPVKQQKLCQVRDRKRTSWLEDKLAKITNTRANNKQIARLITKLWKLPVSFTGKQILKTKKLKAAAAAAAEIEKQISYVAHIY